tara:strand:- start:13206 stop:14336 length:1131 start_codon:yes stop_codon:yes gene_type:complete
MNILKSINNKARLKFFLVKCVPSKNFFIIFLAIIIPLEIIGHFVHDTRYYFDQRYMTLSSNSIQNETSTKIPFWKYKPLSKIRSIGLYANFLETKIEYDCIFNTNKYGFVNTGDIGNFVDYLVVGDSFTEGVGGCPWLTKKTILEEPRLDNIKIINGGLMSAGVRKFEQILYYTRNELKVKNLVIIAISNDFKRDGPGKWHVDRNCYLKQICSSMNNFYIRDFNISNEKLKMESRERRKERGPDYLSEITRYSFTVRTILEYNDIVLSYFFSKNSKNMNSYQNKFIENFKSLSRMKNLYPNLSIILVPTRDEVGFLGKKNKDSTYVEQHLLKENIKFNWCSLTASDFLPFDGHPNKKGYKKLFECTVNEIQNSHGK